MRINTFPTSRIYLSPKRVLFFFFLLLLLQGCGLSKAQKQGISSFGKATEGLSELSSKQFSDFRKDAIEMRHLQFSFEGKTLKAGPRDAFSRTFDFDLEFDPNRIEHRIKASNLLKSYATLLVTLSTKSQDKELKATGDKLSASLKSFGSTSKEADGAGKIVQIAGSFWIEHAKKKALKKIIPHVDQKIRDAINFLKTDFDPTKIGGLAYKIDILQNALATEAIEGLKRGPKTITIECLKKSPDIKGLENSTDNECLERSKTIKGSTQSSNSESDHYLFLMGLRKADESNLKLENISIKITQAVQVMEVAYDKMLELLHNDEISLKEIQDFYKKTNEAVNAAKVFLKNN